MTTSRVSSSSCQVMDPFRGGADELPTTTRIEEADVEGCTIPTKTKTIKKIKKIMPTHQREKEEWWWMTKFPLPILSCIWLALCTGLVLKYPKLLSAFFTFVACWAIRLMAGRRQRAAPHFLITGAAAVALWWGGNVAHALSIIAGYLAYCHWSSSYDVVVSSASASPTSTPTSTVARVTHDALTLTVAVVLLVVYYNADNNNDDDESTTTTAGACCWPSSVSSTTSLWLVTHWVRLLLLNNNKNNDDDDDNATTTNDNSNNNGDMNNSKQILAATAATTTTSITVPANQPPISSTSTTLTNNNGKSSSLDFLADSSRSPATTMMIWRIHGHEYDLSSYVRYHPGGREAILLGANRPDCTALFESYHPFTKATARTVLQKYRIFVRSSSSSATTTSGSDNITVSASTEHHHQQQQQQKQLHDNNSTTTHQNIMHHNKDEDNDVTDDPFYAELCGAVAATLRRHGLDPVRDRAASRSRQIHYGLVAIGVLYSAYHHFQGSILGSFALALFGWLLGSLGHDAGHFCASRSPLLNDVGVLIGMSFLCNPIVWQHQHTYAHHSATNDFDHDPDLHHFTTLLRVHRRFQQYDFYRHQSRRWYVLFAYLFVVFGTCIWIPLGMIRDGTLYGLVDWTDRGRHRGYYGMYLHWIVYATALIAWPFVVHDRWWQAALAVLAHVGTSGLVFAVFSQINHLNEHSFPNDNNVDTDDDEDDDSSRSSATASSSTASTISTAPTTDRQQPPPQQLPLPTSWQQSSSWAAQQVVTSNNFCPHSRLWHILSNGLNLQIEHHLFPGLNHCHLPLIQSTVQSVCAKYGVPYKSYGSWSAIMTATLEWLSRLATEPTTTTAVSTTSRGKEGQFASVR